MKRIIIVGWRNSFEDHSWLIKAINDAWEEMGIKSMLLDTQFETDLESGPTFGSTIDFYFGLDKEVTDLEIDEFEQNIWDENLLYVMSDQSIERMKKWNETGIAPTLKDYGYDGDE